MAFTLKIHLGGLSLLVQRMKTSPGLYVLMAADTMGMGHTPVFGSFTNPSISIAGQDIDLRSQLTGGATAQALSGALTLTKATSGGLVSKSHLGATLSGLVAARIILPLPSAPPRWFELVGVEARYGATTMPLAMGPVGGRLMLEYQVNSSVTIMGQSFTGPAEIVLANLPPDSPLPGEEPYHAAGEKLAHAGMYRGLLDGGPLNPTFYTTEDYGSPQSASKSSMKARPKGASGNLGRVFTPAPWVDPVQCTIGTGCPPDEPSCGS